MSRCAWALLGLAAVAVVVTTGTVGASPRINPINAAPPSLPVTVVNTPSQVSGSVGISGTPTVNVGTPVTVSSLPPVTGNVNATLTNSSVTVANTSASPVLVRNVNDGQNIFAFDLTLTNDTADYGPTSSICLNSANCQISFDVPAGQRFVVEHVSASVVGVAGQTYIVDFLGNVPEFLVVEKQGSLTAFLDLFTASQPMRVYIDSGRVPSPIVQVQANSGANFFARVTISGYLIPLP